MRKHYEAIGKIAAAAHSLGATYEGSTERGEDGQVTLQIAIDLDGHFGHVFGEPHQEYFHIISSHALSNISSFNHQASSEPYVQHKETLLEYAEHQNPEIEVAVLKKPFEGDAVEYFDGYRAVSSIFPYDDNFGPKSLKRTLVGIEGAAQSSFSAAVDDMGINLDSGEDAVEREVQNNESSPTFH